MSRTVRSIETKSEGNKEFKRTANKLFRKKTKNAIKAGNFDELDNSVKGYSTFEKNYKKDVKKS